MVRFDPGQRARDFTREPSPRRAKFSVEQRLVDLSRMTSLALTTASKPPGNTTIEIVNELPWPTPLDIGRQIILRKLGEPDIYFMGLMGSDGIIQWIEFRSADEQPVNSPEFTWIQHKVLGVPATGVCSRNSYVYVTVGPANALRYIRSSGSLSIVLGGFPTDPYSATGVWGKEQSSPVEAWLAEPDRNAVERYDGSSKITTSASNDYWGLWAVEGSSIIYATCVAENKCVKLNWGTLALQSTFASGEVSGPKGIAADSAGNVYVADTGNHRIRKYNSSLSFVSQWGSLGGDDGEFASPQGLAVDSSDRLYVADSANHRIQVFSSTGSFLGKFGGFGTGSGSFDTPVDVGIAGTNIEVADYGNGRISFWTRT